MAPWLVINELSAILAFIVVGVLMVTKFGEGAWIIFVVAPPMYLGLLRLHRQYETEGRQLVGGVAAATEERLLPHHIVVIFIDKLDLAGARAVRYARTLRPEELRAVHFDIDEDATDDLAREVELPGACTLSPGTRRMPRSTAGARRHRVCIGGDSRR